MNSLVVVCVDDEREILSSLIWDLKEFEEIIQIEQCESAEEAYELIEDSSQDKNIALLITDHLMPGTSGAELLNKICQLPNLEHMKGILLTGQATHSDTIHAINSNRLNCYIAKPWEKENFVSKVKDLLTDYVIEKELDLIPYMKHLNKIKLLKATSESPDAPW